MFFFRCLQSHTPRMRSEDLSLALGPGSSSWGRRPKRQLATVAIGDGGVESESEASEPDLGASVVGRGGVLEGVDVMLCYVMIRYVLLCYVMLLVDSIHIIDVLYM